MNVFSTKHSGEPEFGKVLMRTERIALLAFWSQVDWSLRTITLHRDSPNIRPLVSSSSNAVDDRWTLQRTWIERNRVTSKAVVQMAALCAILFLKNPQSLLAQPPTVTCSSQEGGDRQHCAADTSAGVAL